MLWISFINPIMLGLLLLLPAFWAFALLTPRRLVPWRFWFGLLARSVIIASLILALAGTQLIRPVRELTTVFLIDASDSVAPSQREQATRYVEDALATMPPGDQAAVVVFGENALVERAPSNLGALGRLVSAPLTTRTNIQDAIQLGLALLPAETQKRLVLLSDGGENSGRAADAARLAAVRGVPIDIIHLPGEYGPDVVVSSLNVPSTVREGQDIAPVVALSSSFATSGKLQVFVDNQLALERDITIPAGVSSFPLRIPAGDAGFRRLEVRLEAQGDTQPQNNRAAGFSEIQGPPRLLLIASDPARTTNLQAALEASGVRVDVRPPDQTPVALEILGAYAGIVLVDTPARALPRGLIGYDDGRPGVLEPFVRELGRGIAMIGGTESFGAGGYRRTSVERILPVNLDPRDTSQQPDLALVMVIDRSGSMEEAGTSGGRTKLDLAKEAVYQASLGLSQRDQIGLVVFDDQAQWVLPVRKLPPAIEIEQALSTFNTGGGTNIRPGVEQAAQALATVNARIKHVILLTDGIADSNYTDLIDQMRQQGITISTIAIGSDANPNLEQIAIRGGGRFARVQRAEEVPQIFLQETVIVAGRDIIEESFTPGVALRAPVVRDLGNLPTLYGYNGSEIKPAARSILVTPDGKPILAQWQYGLGRAVAWTSDMQGKWARDWVTWGQFPRFAGGLADLLLPPRDASVLSLRASTAGAQSVLELTAQDDQGRPLNDLQIEARLIDPANQGKPAQFSQIGSGRYRATVQTSDPGVYLAQVAATDASGRALGVATTGMVVSYSLEYGAQRDNEPLLRDLAKITGGRAMPPVNEVFAPTGQSVGSVREIGLPLLWLALLLWPLDIAVRRLMIRLEDLSPALAAIRHRWFPDTTSTPVQIETMARLSAAKRRAGRELERPTQPARQNVGAEPAVIADPLPQAPTEEIPTPQTPAADEQFARLLAAKQRARKKRE